MNEELKQSQSDMGKAYIAELTKQLLRAGKKSSGSLINSLSYEVLSEVNGFTINILANDYLGIIDAGRRKGVMPPVKAILPWVKKKGIRIKGSTDEQTAFVIARSIGKKGIQPTNVMARTQQMVLSNLEDLATMGAMEDLESVIDTAIQDFS